MAIAGTELTESQEDYLEAILRIVRQDRVARVRDIAARLGVGMPSVSGALKALARRGLVNYDPYQFVTLTDAGTDLAGEITQKHEFLRLFLAEVLGLDAPAAETNACRIEHALDSALLDRLRQLDEFLRHSPTCGSAWIESFRQWCAQRQPSTPQATEGNP